MGFLDGTPDPYNEFNGTQRFYDNWYSQKRENQIVAEFQAEIDRLREELADTKSRLAERDLDARAHKAIVSEACDSGLMTRDQAVEKYHKFWKEARQKLFG